MIPLWKSFANWWIKRTFWVWKKEVESLGLQGDLKTAVVELPYLYGGVELLERLQKLDLGECSRNALRNLGDVLTYLERRTVSPGSLLIWV